jgi:hypothetical protein
MNMSYYKSVWIIATETHASHSQKKSVEVFDGGIDGISNYGASWDAMYVEHGSCSSVS